LREPCGKLVEAALERGLLINVTADTVIRLLPPLIVGEPEVRRIVDILGQLIDTTAA
jgi:acetylornithine aminotransferase